MYHFQSVTIPNSNSQSRMETKSKLVVVHDSSSLYSVQVDCPVCEDPEPETVTRCAKCKESCCSSSCIVGIVCKNCHDIYPRYGECPVCGDWPEASSQCAICSANCCAGDCGVGYCIGCNHDDPQKFRPCSWACQRQRFNNDDGEGTCYWNEGFICEHCHLTYLRSGEMEQLLKCGVDKLVVAALGDHLSRLLAYIGKDKMKYFLEYNSNKRNRDGELVNMCASMALDDGLDIPLSLKKIRYSIFRMYNVETPRLRPW